MPCAWWNVSRNKSTPSVGLCFILQYLLKLALSRDSEVLRGILRCLSRTRGYSPRPPARHFACRSVYDSRGMTMTPCVKCRVWARCRPIRPVVLRVGAGMIEVSRVFNVFIGSFTLEFIDFNIIIVYINDLNWKPFAEHKYLSKCQKLPKYRDLGSDPSHLEDRILMLVWHMILKLGILTYNDLFYSYFKNKW